MTHVGQLAFRMEGTGIENWLHITDQNPQNSVYLKREIFRDTKYKKKRSMTKREGME